MIYKKDELRLETDFPYAMFTTDSRQMYLHSHDFLEINSVQKGAGYYLIEEKEYEIQTGDIYVINNRERHMAVHDGTLLLDVFVFDPSLLWDRHQGYQFVEPFFSGNFGNGNCIRNSDEGYCDLHGILNQMKDEYMQKKDGWQLFISSWIRLFMADLYRLNLHNYSRGADKSFRNKTYTRLQPVIDYLHENYLEQLNLDELAEVAMMNKSYLCTCFKDFFHLRIFEYIDQLRTDYACLLLTTTQMSITEVAMETGFNSVSYFNRVFKKTMGCAPGEYRKKYSK